MTTMKRITVSFPPEIDKEIFELRKKDNFVRCSYSEIVRQLIILGLDASGKKKRTLNK